MDIALAKTIQHRPTDDLMKIATVALEQVIPDCHVDKEDPKIFGNLEGRELLKRLGSMEVKIETQNVCSRQCHKLSKTVANFCLSRRKLRPRTFVLVNGTS